MRFTLDPAVFVSPIAFLPFIFDVTMQFSSSSHPAKRLSRRVAARLNCYDWMARTKGERSRNLGWGVALVCMLGSQVVLPGAVVWAQTVTEVKPVLNLSDDSSGRVDLGGGNAITKIAGPKIPKSKIKPSATTGCPPGGDCQVTVEPLDLSRTPTEKELRMAGQMGGALTPLFSADPQKLEKKYDDELKAAGIPQGIAAAQAPQTTQGKIALPKKKKVERMKAMNLEFGQAMQKWNAHQYVEAAGDLTEYLKKYPDSPWAGEAALHLGCDSKYNGRFNEAQMRFEEILNNTSADQGDPSWDIHQKAKLRWADLDIALGRFGDAGDKLSNLLTNENQKDWRRMTWARHWLRNTNAMKNDARQLRACGARALGFVLASVGKKSEADAIARLTPTQLKGFSLAEMAEMSAQKGLKLEGVRATSDDLASLPLPFIIHYDFGDAKRAQSKRGQEAFWPLAQGAQASESLVTPANFQQLQTKRAKLAKRDAPFKASEEAGHFLVVKSVDAERKIAHLFDPQEGRSYNISYAQLDREWSGAGLRIADAKIKTKLSANAATSGGKAPIRLSMAQLKQFVGGCCGVAKPGGSPGPSPGPPGGGTPGPTSPCAPKGSPLASINPVTINLNFWDIPLWYSTPVGPDVEISMSYNSQEALNQNTAFGNKWAFGYGSYLVEDTGDGGGVVTIFMPLGAQANYLPQSNNGYKPDQPDNFNRLVKVGQGRFELIAPDGSKMVYGIPEGTNSMQPYLIEQYDKFGYKLTFGYDSNVRLNTITDAQGKVTRLWHDEFGHIVRARTPQGREANWTYDNNGNMVEVVDIEGNAFQYVYDREIRVVELTTAQGSWTYKHEGPDGNVLGLPYPAPDAPMWAAIRLTVANPLGEKEEYFYDAVPNPSYFHIDARNYRNYNGGDNNYAARVSKTVWKATTMSDGRGKITDVALPSADGGATVQTVKTEYDPVTMQASAIVDARGRRTSWTRNAQAQITSVTDSDGRTSRIQYADNGRDITRVIDWQGKTQAMMTYSGPGQVASISTPAASGQPSQTANLTYTPWGAPLAIGDSEGTSFFGYDGQGQLQSIARNGSVMGSFTYNPDGQLATTTDAGGQWAGYEYDELGQVRKVTYSDGTSTESQTLCCGMPGATRDRAGRWTYYDYDQLKRPIRVQDPTGNTLEMKYDAGGNLTRLLDAKGNATRFSYDAIGRLQTKTYADNTFVSWNYDALGRMDAQRDAQGKVTRYLYDADDRLRKIDYPTSADVTVNYDAQDRPNSVTDAIGTTRVTYDELDRVKAVDGPWDSDTVSYEYDAVGRRKTLRVNGVAGVGSEDASYVYDTLGRLQKLTGMAGEFNYSYVGETGALSQLQLPNGTKTVYGYDNLERLTSLTNQKNTGELLSRYAYGYEETHAGGNYALRGLRTSMDSQLSDIATGAAQQAQRTLYAYSGDSQLTGESTTPIAGQGQNMASSWNRSYGYDAMGNRTSATQTNEDGVISNSSSTPNKLNQLTAYSTNTTTGTASSAMASALIYDARGNLSEQASKVDGVDAGRSRYVYDDLNRLVSLTSLNAAGVAQSQTRFVYDFASRKCVQQTFSWNNGAWQKTSEKRYIYDEMEVVQERDESNTVTASNLWSSSVGGLLARRTQNATTFPSYDANGNVTGLTDVSGARVAKYRYDAFGNTLEASGPQAASNPYRFSTKEAVGGLYYFGFRFYSPGLGRWITRDPIEEDGGMNLYSFGPNSPPNGYDEYGADWVDDTSNFFAGWGDTLTFGATKYGRKYVGEAFGVGDANESVDYCSGAYTGGEWVGFAHSMAFGAGGGAKPAAAAGSKILNLFPKALDAYKNRYAFKFVGNYIIKSVNPKSSRLLQFFARGELNAQARALGKLGDLGAPHIYRNGKLVMRNIGEFAGSGKEAMRIWWRGSKRMGNFINDIRPHNIGANGQIFDPALPPVQQWIYGSIGAGTAGGLGYGYWWVQN